MILSCQLRVVNVEQKFKLVHIAGTGKDAIMRQENLGWFVTFDNFMCVPWGQIVPSLDIGDYVKFSLETLPPGSTS
jgi:hypothetical protein